MPVAIDQHIHRRLKDEEGKLFARVLKQAGEGLDGRSQGVYIFSPSAELLAHSNTTEAKHVKQLMDRALEKYTPGVSSVNIDKTSPDQHYFAEPPDGTVVLDVTSKVLGGYEHSEDRREEIYQKSMGYDHLWLRRDEAKAIARGTIPEAVSKRIVRFHLVDNTRGEPPYWHSDEIREFDLSLENGRIRGHVHLETDDGERGYEAELLGYVEGGNGILKRIDIVAHGMFWGEGRYTGGAPEGRFPFAVTFRLAEMNCTADYVLPGAARGGLQSYLR